MHSLIRPWILAHAPGPQATASGFFTLISKFNRCWAVTLLSRSRRWTALSICSIQYVLVEQHDNHVVEVVAGAGIEQDAHNVAK